MAEINNREMEEKLEELQVKYIEKLQGIINDMSFDEELELVNAYRERHDEGEIMELNRENFNQAMYGCSPWEVLEALNNGDFDPDDPYFINENFGSMSSCDDIWFEDEPDDVIEALMSEDITSDCSEIRECLEEYSEKELEIRDSYNTKACIRELKAKAEEMRDIYRRYRANGRYLSIFLTTDENGKDAISINNRYWAGGEDEDFKIKYSSAEEEDN